MNLETIKEELADADESGVALTGDSLIQDFA